MSMESNHHVSEDFQSFNHPSIHQHQNIICYNPEVCGQVQQATNPFIQTMPSQGIPVMEAVQVSQESTLYPLWQSFTSRSEPVTHRLSRDDVSLNTSSQLEQQASQQTVCTNTGTSSGFRFKTAPHHEHEACRYSPESCYSNHPINRESRIDNNQEFRFCSQQHGSVEQLGHNYNDVLVTKCTESDCVAMGRSDKELQVHVHVGSSPPKNFQTTVTSLTTTCMSQPQASSNSQHLSIRTETKAHNINFIRKLRQRERSNGGNWKSKEKKHGKRNQHDMDEDSFNYSPCKQFISEERMAAKMSNLSIRNDNKMATLQERWLQAKVQVKRQLEELENRLSDSESDVDLESDTKEGDGSNQQPYIQVSPELKTALSQQEGLLPDSIIKSISNTCNQLVLWKPPTSYLGDVITSSSNHGHASQDNSDLQSCDSVIQTAEEDPTSCRMELEARYNHITPFEIARPIGSDIILSGPNANATELFDSMDDDMDL